MSFQSFGAGESVTIKSTATGPNLSQYSIEALPQALYVLNNITGGGVNRKAYWIETT